MRVSRFKLFLFLLAIILGYSLATVAWLKSLSSNVSDGTIFDRGKQMLSAAGWSSYSSEACAAQVVQEAFQEVFLQDEVLQASEHTVYGVCSHIDPHNAGSISRIFLHHIRKRGCAGLRALNSTSTGNVNPIGEKASNQVKEEVLAWQHTVELYGGCSDEGCQVDLGEVILEDSKHWHAARHERLVTLLTQMPFYVDQKYVATVLSRAVSVSNLLSDMFDHVSELIELVKRVLLKPPSLLQGKIPSSLADLRQKATSSSRIRMLQDRQLSKLELSARMVVHCLQEGDMTPFDRAFVSVPHFVRKPIVRAILNSIYSCRAVLFGHKMWCDALHQGQSEVSLRTWLDLAENKLDMVQNAKYPASMSFALLSFFQQKKTWTVSALWSACGVTDGNSKEALESELPSWELAALKDLCTSSLRRGWAACSIKHFFEEPALQSVAVAILHDIIETKGWAIEKSYPKPALMVPLYEKFQDEFRAKDLTARLLSNPYVIFGPVVRNFLSAAFGRERLTADVESLAESLSLGNVTVPDIVQEMKVHVLRSCGRQGASASVRLPAPFANLQRQEEYFETLQWNVCNPVFASVKLLLGSKRDAAILENRAFKLKDSSDNQLKLFLPQQFLLDSVNHPADRQPFYADMIHFAFVDGGPKPVLISNGDIAWQHSSVLLSVKPIHIWGKLIMLSRSEFDRNSQRTCCDGNVYDGCTDGFMLLPTLPRKMYEEIMFQQNVWGAENYLSHVFHSWKYKVNNLCKTIGSFHVHESSHRPSQNPSRINHMGGQNVACCPGGDVNASQCASCDCENCGIQLPLEIETQRNNTMSNEFRAVVLKKLDAEFQDPKFIPDAFKRLNVPTDWKWESFEELA